MEHSFDLIHLDLWTSPVVSVSGSKYYLIILNDFTHYLWTFSLKLKSDTFTTLSRQLVLTGISDCWMTGEQEVLTAQMESAFRHLQKA
jgi:hypothetical protein